MNESQLFEMLGRKQAECDTLRTEYAKLLDVLVGVLAGTIATADVETDVSTQSWSIKAKVS